MLVLDQPDPTNSLGERLRMELPPIEGLVVGGKFGPGWQPVYDERQAFVDAGFEVAFPRGAAPLDHFSGYTFSSKQEEYIPFPYMQGRVFELIAKNGFHTAILGKRNPDGGGVDGYSGFSTCHEIAYAILNAKPIITSSGIESMPSSTPQAIMDILYDNQRKFIVEVPSSLSIKALQKVIASLPEHVEYDVNEDQLRTIERLCDDLCLMELHRWLSWTLYTERASMSGGGTRPDWVNERRERKLVSPVAYLSPEAMASDPDAQMYVNRQLHESFMVHSFFPDFGD